MTSPRSFSDRLNRRTAVIGLTSAVIGAGVAGWAGTALAAEDTYDQDSILKAATDFLGSTTEGLAKVIERLFKEQGQPNGYIQGEEASVAITVGLRYGDGELVMKSGARRKVFWAGPSLGRW